MTEYQNDTDEALALRTQEGDAVAFGVLVERYEQKLSRYGTRFLKRDEDIEDMLQDIFIKAYRNIQSFKSEQRFSPWLYRIAHNTFVNEIRRKSRVPFVFVDFDTLLSHPRATEETEQKAEAREMKEMVQKGLDAISEKHREVLILFYEQELSYKEIADVLQVPLGTVGVRMQRAKKALVQAYAKMNIQYEF